MLRPSLRTLPFLAITAAQLLMASPMPAHAQAVAVDTYLSPTFGYSLTYDASWQVLNSTSSTNGDFLQLYNETSYMLFVGSDEFVGSVPDCVAGTVEQITSATPYSNVSAAVDSEGNQLVGGTAASEFAVYDYTYTNEDGSQEAWVLDVECVALTPDDATLAIVLDAPAIAYADELAARKDLVAGLDLVPPFAESGPVCADGSLPPQGGEGGEGGESVFGEDGQDGADGADGLCPEEGSVTPASTTTTEDTVSLSSTVDPELAELIDFTLTDLDVYWAAQFEAQGLPYESPAAIIPFDELIDTPCGTVPPMVTGSLYCPLDQTIYLDMQALVDQTEQLGLAPVAETIAHEWGHHIELLLGVIDPETSGSIAWSLTGSTALETELMADCLSGNWIYSATAQGVFTPRDHDAMVIDLATIGDSAATPYDRQHGNGALRAWWFLRGLHEGPGACLDAA